MPSASPKSVRIRSYNVGFGDCFLLTFAYATKEKHVLIDFGSFPKPAGVSMVKIAEHIEKTCTGGDLAIVATHRHADHINGFGTDGRRIVRAAKARGCFLELNSQPDRLDLDDLQCRMAKEEGVPVAISSDAHSVYDFSHLQYGVGQARRGWLEPKDVLNTRSLEELRPLLARTMGR